MTTPKRFALSRIVALACLIGLTACVSAPQGPRVAVMPTPGKPLDLFAAEDQYCRGYAHSRWVLMHGVRRPWVPL